MESTRQALSYYAEKPLYGLAMLNLEVAVEMGKMLKDGSQIVEVALLALGTFVANLLLFLPFGAIYILGRLIEPHSATASIRKLMAIKATPVPIPAPKDIDLDPLLEKYLPAAREYKIVQSRIEQIKNRDMTVLHTTEAGYVQLELYLCALLEKELPSDHAVWGEVAHAFGPCFPTAVEVVREAYEAVARGRDEAAEAMYTAVSNFKKERLRRFAEHELGLEWHALNFVRFVAGEELGIEMGSMDYDPTIVNQMPQSVMNLSKVIGRFVVWLFIHNARSPCGDKIIEQFKTAFDALIGEQLSTVQAHLYEKENADELLDPQTYEITPEGVDQLMSDFI